jgi:hypothetical protein
MGAVHYHRAIGADSAAAVSSHAFRRSPVGTLLTAVTVTLSLTTAYIHLTLGSVLFTLNAAGYVGRAAADPIWD